MWPVMLTDIDRNIKELERLQKLLLTKRERFKFKLDSVCISLLKRASGGTRAHIDLVTYGIEPKSNRDEQLASQDRGITG